MSFLSLAKRIVGKQDQSPKKKSAPKQKGGAATRSKSKKQKKVKKEHVSLKAAAIDMNVLISEKSMVKQEDNVVAVHVKPGAAKSEIAAAFAEKFGARPLGVRTANVRGKARRRGYASGSTKAWKKAYVTVEDVSKLSGDI